MASKKINVVNEPSAISILDKSGQDPTTSNKKNRQTDVSTNGLPGVNDILTGKFLELSSIILGKVSGKTPFSNFFHKTVEGLSTIAALDLRNSCKL